MRKSLTKARRRLSTNCYTAQRWRREIDQSIKKVHSEKTIKVTVTMQALRLVTERLIIENLTLQDYPKNVASIALLEKIGMRKEAHFKQSVL